MPTDNLDPSVLSKSTPGPWRISGILESGSVTVVAPEMRIVICDVHNAASFGDFVVAAIRDRRFGDPKDAHTQQANARLIAAAPDLLDAVKGLRLHLKLFCGPDDAIANSVFEIADAALKKAGA